VVERRLEQLHRRMVALEHSAVSAPAAPLTVPGREAAAARVAPEERSAAQAPTPPAPPRTADAERVVEPAAAAATAARVTDTTGAGAPRPGVASRPAVAAAPTPPSPPPPSRPAVSLEERLGARLPVWIGAIALVLGAGYLVKLSFDQGWIGPTVRVTIGTLFGVGLLAGGELLRRSTQRVAQGLTAAGIAVLFVVEWAALALYHLVSPPTAFALLALTTATAVALSLRQGAIVALLGLVGGFFTPLLVASPSSDPRQLFAYLLLLEAGLLAVSRRRGWGPLAALNLAGALAWGI
jgi:uncharacterized membrane protein